MDLAYLNGKFLPLADAKVSALDRGFVFGDGVYEVIPVYSNNYILREKEHLVRLDNSLKAIEIDIPLTHAEWHEIFTRLLAQPHADTCAIYLQVTRGAPTKRLHTFPVPPVTPTVFAFVSDITIKTPAELAKGFSVTTHEDIRWKNCFIKAITLLPNLLMLEHAKRAGFDEVILIRDGLLTEASASNVFIVKDGVILTPPANGQILGGITRTLVLELLAKHKIPYKETDITEQEVLDADEIWFTSSTKEIAPVIKLNDKSVSGGKPGSMWHKVHPLFTDYLRAEVAKQK